MAQHVYRLMMVAWCWVVRGLVLIGGIGQRRTKNRQRGNDMVMVPVEVEGGWMQKSIVGLVEIVEQQEDVEI